MWITVIVMLLLSPNNLFLNITSSSSLHYSACNFVAANYQYLWTNFTATMGKMRIFLLGDSLIGQMCRDTKVCDRNRDGSVYSKTISPLNSDISNWAYFKMHRLQGAPSIEIYHLGIYGGRVALFEKELFHMFHPNSSDVLITLFGAHLHTPEVVMYTVIICMKRKSINLT